MILTLLPLAHGQNDCEARGSDNGETEDEDLIFYINKEDDVSRDVPHDDDDEKITETGKLTICKSSTISKPLQP